jgi:hypothetical protein
MKMEHLVGTRLCKNVGHYAMFIQEGIFTSVQGFHTNLNVLERVIWCVSNEWNEKILKDYLCFNYNLGCMIMDALIAYGMLKWGKTFKPIVKNLFEEEYLFQTNSYEPFWKGKRLRKKVIYFQRLMIRCTN